MAGHAMPRQEIFALRQAIARIEGKSVHAARMAAEDQERLESATADAAAPGPERLDAEALLQEALQPGAMTEIRSTRLGEAGAASGFALALALSRPAVSEGRHLVIGDPQVAREAGLPYAPGLGDFGFRPQQFIHALPRRLEDALWLADAALASRAFTTILLEIHGNPRKFGLTESRRLGLKTRATDGLLLLIRHAGEEEASSASLRLKVEPAPAAARRLTDGSMLGGSIGNPVFRVLSEKSRFPASCEFFLEWNPHERRLSPVLASVAAQPFPGRPPHPGALLPAAGDRSAGAQALGHVLAFERAS
ncbi:hypothetical protein [Rhizobium sp. RU36D]|uniref:hypothetical protein n=1 Tax=Rhizobium sp. RU36D TaxID=1907415 RepID=UPI0009D8AED8|nr:hypothetical protein [Rhizobium sp. RU36D]SMC88537.1 protein ImuA [Rhizobium sp. RU36D]